MSKKAKKKFKVYVSWQMSKVVEVSAETLDDAISKVADDEIEINVDKDGEYVNGSFDVDYDCTNSLNEEANNG